MRSRTSETGSIFREEVSPPLEFIDPILKQNSEVGLSGRCNGPLVRRACWTILWVAGTSPAGRKLFVCHSIHLYYVLHHSSKTININIINICYRFFDFIKYFATSTFSQVTRELLTPKSKSTDTHCDELS